jgi:CarD family transcriptional regulator
MSDEQQRKERFRDLACRADTFELICLIQTLVEHQKTVAARGKKLHVADERMLQEAEKLVCDEFSYVLGIPKEEVPSYITEGMKERVH